MVVLLELTGRTLWHNTFLPHDHQLSCNPSPATTRIMAGRDLPAAIEGGQRCRGETVGRQHAKDGSSLGT